jgi:hypothetical protein
MPLPGCCLHLIPRRAVETPAADHNREVMIMITMMKEGYGPRIYEIVPANEYDTKSK